jgi:hypothetical protein
MLQEKVLLNTFPEYINHDVFITRESEKIENFLLFIFEDSTDWDDTKLENIAQSIQLSIDLIMASNNTTLGYEVNADVKITTYSY